MKRTLALIAGALLLTATVTGCSATLNNRLQSAAATQGALSAGITLPPWPAECRIAEPHASIHTGDELRALLKRERAALNRANARTKRCAEFYDDLLARMGGKP
jgi:hypothetical protein